MQETCERRADLTETLTDADSGIGRVLFFGDREGSVLSCSDMDRGLARGESFWDKTGLSPETVNELRREMAEGGSLWVISSLGVGILVGRYELWTGVYLYIHLNEQPRLLKYAVCKGLLKLPTVQLPACMEMRTRRPTDWEDPAFLMRLSRMETLLRRGFAHTLAYQPDIPISVSCVHDFARAVSPLLGVSAQVIDGESDALNCPAPLLLEGMLLSVLCLLGELSVNREAALDVHPIVDGEGFYFRISVLVEMRYFKSGSADIRALLSLGDILCARCEVNGLRMIPTLDPCGGDDARGWLAVKVNFDKHPAKDPPTSLKTKFLLDYENGEA
ncbi:MAG: hypothetical protein IJW00_10840 [Clostridia bacterium]|nr:hypothetical protein [Clostridia bacterium]